MPNFDDKIIELWFRHSDRPEAQTELVPLLLGDLRTGVPLFVGLNPSFPTDPKSKFIKFAKAMELHTADFLWPSLIERRDFRERLVRLQRACQEEDGIPFFKKFHELLGSHEWEHLDLFFVRKTEHKRIKKPAWHKKAAFLDQFWTDQYLVFEQMIDAIKPTVIIVANAAASEILEHKWADRLKFNCDNGWHNLHASDRCIPVFFSSMLSGGASSNGNFRRLRWHVRKAIAHGSQKPS